MGFHVAVHSCCFIHLMFLCMLEIAALTLRGKRMPGAGCTSPAPKNAPGMGAPFCLLVQVQMPTRPAAYVMPSHLLVPAAIWQHLPGSIGAALVHTAGRQWQDVTAHSVSQGPTSSTYIQFLLQEYRRNLGAVGSVFTQVLNAFVSSGLYDACCDLRF